MIHYHIKMNGRYLQGIEPNKHYSRTGTAPTMGNRHTPAEYKSIWSAEPKAFEPLTAASYIKVVFEEFRWKDRKPQDIRLIPVEK
jgi:hypothetical protein